MFLSTTNTELDTGSTAMPDGPLSCPFALPVDPHVVINVPLRENCWIRSLPVSVTYSEPDLEFT
ncbi:MAG: hypothetical protein M3Z01_04440, partial [Thermoproteota archaeon]|nr:hypothetical protein [Thermoproteota archaeon]